MTQKDDIFQLPILTHEQEKKPSQIEDLQKQVHETILGILAIEELTWMNYHKVKENLVTVHTALGQKENIFKAKVLQIISLSLEIIQEELFTQENTAVRKRKIQEHHARILRPILVEKCEELLWYLEEANDMQDVQFRTKIERVIDQLSQWELDVEGVQKADEALKAIGASMEKKINTRKLFELYKVFTFLKEQELQGVKGCYEFDSGIPWPVVGITISTHGNEPAGLAVFKYFYENTYVPEKGKVVFTCNNIRATEEFFTSISEDEKEAGRMSRGGVNMNRLKSDVLERTPENYEETRAQELQKVQINFTSALDIHSTLTWSTPMLISINADIPQIYLEWLPLKTVIEDICEVQSGIPICKLYGQKSAQIPIIGIECWQHEDPRSYEVALDATLGFIENSIWAYDGNIGEWNDKSIERMSVKTSIKFPKWYTVCKDFWEFEEIKKWAVLGIDENGKEVVSPLDGIILFGKKKGYSPESTSAEVFFIMQRKID